MNLRDLFPEDLDANSLTSQSFPQPLPNPGQKSIQPQWPGPMVPPPSSQQQPSSSFPAQMQTRPDASPASSVGMSSAFNQRVNSPPSVQSQSGSFYPSDTYSNDFANMPSMDFLNLGNEYDTNNFPADGTVDMNFGLGGLDFTHDWNNGEGGFGVDLFDGFFFGNNGVGGANVG
jgi:hypothetical protein